MSGACNYVWNYCIEVTFFAWKRDKHLLSFYDLCNLTKGTSKILGIESQTIKEVCRQYVASRNQHRKKEWVSIKQSILLQWRSGRRNLGWIPFKSQGVKIIGDYVTYYGQHSFRMWLSRPIEGILY
jgi:hypothetical protein